MTLEQKGLVKTSVDVAAISSNGHKPTPDLLGSPQNLKIPGEVIKASVGFMNAAEQGIYEWWQVMANLGYPIQAALDSTRPFIDRFDQLTKEPVPTIATPMECWWRIAEVSMCSAVATYHNFLEAGWRSVDKAAQASRLLIEAKSRELKGITPYEVVASDGFVQLRHYRSTAPEDQKIKEPLILITPPMNRPEILDIYPGRSLIRALTDGGVDVFLVDWGGDKLRAKQQGWETERNKTLDHAVLQTIPTFVETASSIAGSKDVNIGSYCLGTIIAASYLALQSEIQPEIDIKSIFKLTPVIDFGKKAANRLFEISADPTLNMEDVVKAFGGVMDGGAVDWGARLRDPDRYLIGANLAAYDIVGKEARQVEFWKQMASWLAQPVDFPGPMYLRIFNEIFNGDKLARGLLTLQGNNGISHRVDLANITAPVLLVKAGEDDIVDNTHSQPSNFPNSRVTTIVKDGVAHVSLVLSGRKNGFYQDCTEWLIQHSTSRVNTRLLASI